MSGKVLISPSELSDLMKAEPAPFSYLSPRLVPPLGSFLSAASRSSASVGAESGVDVASSAPARCNVTLHREQNCQGSAHCYLSNRFRSHMA